MTHGEKVRFNATVINRTAAVVEAPLLTWDVQATDGEPGYRVDLSQFSEGTQADSPPLVKYALARRRVYKPGRPGYLNVAPHPDLIRSLASSIRVWTAGVSLRTVNEVLSQLKHLFNFLAVAEKAVGISARNRYALQWQLTEMSPELFQQFAEYLRRLGLSSVRMGGVYSGARAIVERAAGIEYLPSSPFSTLPDGAESPQYSFQQMKALLDIAKTVIRNFKQDRKLLLQGDGRTQIRGFISQRLRAGQMQFSQSPGGLPAYIAHSVFPSLRVTSAFVLLALLRSGANLQPILGLAPRNWSQPNPFSSKYSTVVMIKNRRGRVTEAKIIKIPTLKRPQFYLYRTLRYYELLVAPLRIAMSAGKDRRANSEIQRERYISTLNGRFWLHLNNNLELTNLGENSAIRGINMLIAEACVRSPSRYLCLLDFDGKPIRFSSKAIRDNWFEFVLRNSKYNLVAGQIALSHSTDSPSISHYIRHKWARRFAEREMRRFQSAAIAVLDEKAVDFSPKAVRVTLDGGDILTLAKENQGRYGAYCRDPLAPPPDVYKPKHEGDTCPAISCDDCPYANYFNSSLPELVASIDLLERQGNEMPKYLWEDSSDWERLGRLKELLSRFPATAVANAKEEAKKIILPNIQFRITEIA